ncbi:MAG: hypothetical protein JJE09_11115 [Bacteroidia bacterium]|nr:hypothetical protein [Bacteroidia bacterium]
MRAIYIFIVLFLTWCIICARWYIFSVKGLLLDPTHFNPHETTMAIVEILFMVLVAFLLGFAIAWLLRESSLKQKQGIIQYFEAEKSALLKTTLEQKSQLEQNKIDRLQINEELLQAAREKEKLNVELEIEKKDRVQMGNELTILRPKIQESDLELQLVNFRLKQTEQLITEKEEGNQKLLVELENLRASKRNERREPVFSDFITDQLLAGISQPDKNERDDLKTIGGIGPGIEKKLNNIGITTFKQISELTEESAKEVSNSIKFFPGRIQRDRWVEQASVLYLEKLRK